MLHKKGGKPLVAAEDRMSSSSDINSYSNLVCIRHPQYTGEQNPDLSCKICCSKFVAKIRAEQAMKFERTWTTTGSSHKSHNFQPMKANSAEKNSSKRQVTFDGSWV